MKMLFDLLMVYDLTCVLVSAWLSYYIYIVLLVGTSVEGLSYVLITVVAMAVFFAVGRQRGQYEVPTKFDLSHQISLLIYTCAATVTSAFTLIFFMKVQAEFSRVWVLLWVAFLLLLTTAGRVVAAGYIESSMKKGMLKRSIALIGAGSQFQTANAALKEDKHYFIIANSVDLSSFAEKGSTVCTAAADQIKRFVADARDKHVDEVVVALPATMGAALEKVLQEVQILPVDVQVLPDFGGAKIPVRYIQRVADLPVITSISKPVSEWGAFLKIAEDFIIGASCLVLFAPAMAIIAIAIKLDTQGPVFFRQRRHGYNHQVIEVLKFRTMTVLEDGDVIRQATKGDKRVTRVGAFLRRTSLDEIPQFWNVVRGEMSVVGPRPHALAHNTYYGNLVENYFNRHRVKPGITGWAQVHGFRGETNDPDMMAKRVQFDLEYIENWSIWLDLKIIIMTPFFGLFRRGAY
jgi:putative colanic acid biosynthesis UDP-glucose lipid carrier transferase